MIPIGCSVKEEGFLYAQKVDGIFGLANKEDSIINQLYKEGKINKRIVSLCFSQNGGYLTLGNVYRDYHINSPVYFPITMKDVYSLNINSVYLNYEKKFESQNFPANIDSGTTLTYFPTNLSTFIVDSFKEKCNSTQCGKYIKDNSYGHCFSFESIERLNKAVDNLWPSINFIINGNYNFVWKPMNYMVNITKGDEVKACLGFEETNLDKIILGTTWMHGYEIIFDLDKNMIGFLNTDCNQRAFIIDKNELFEHTEERQKEKQNEYNNESTFRPLSNKQPPKIESNSNDFLYIVIILPIFIIVFLGCASSKLTYGKNVYASQ